MPAVPRAGKSKLSRGVMPPLRCGWELGAHLTGSSAPVLPALFPAPGLRAALLCSWSPPTWQKSKVKRMG